MTALERIEAKCYAAKKELDNQRQAAIKFYTDSVKKNVRSENVPEDYLKKVSYTLPKGR